MEYIGWFIFDFILIFIVYYFVFIRKSLRGVHVPTEAQYIISLYKLDTNLFSYHKFILLVGLVSTFDISLVATIVAVIDRAVIWQILFGFVAVVPVILLTFMFLGKYYQVKQTKNNTKELKKEIEYLKKLKLREEKKEIKKNKKQEKKKGR